ncbi:MAG: 5'-methylthioadenosine/adenosylhomocysteine nucleosidase [Paramuribaculum sp.]|nr:5'-methylthioadenosine/adenosylhomocysteine nucleosidase [Paramuribaculum sp.]
MTIGIIVAMDKELQLLLPSIEEISAETIDGFTFYTGLIAGRRVCVAKCGIGKVNAAVGTLALINRFSPDLVINTGVAGGAGGGAGVLDVVVADRIAYHDVWCGPGTEEGQAAECPKFFTPPSEMIQLCGDAVLKGLICSGDRFISKAEEVARIRGIYPDAMAVDMESAAIAHVCYLKKIPFICIRVISDTPGEEDNISQYENFWDDAPKGTFSALSTLLANLPEKI